jgi:hypothetical protein
MGDQAAERRIDEAGMLLRAVASYRLAVEGVIELRTEARALTRRLTEIPGELQVAEMREAEARRLLLQAAKGVHNGPRTQNDIEEEGARAKRSLDAGITGLNARDGSDDSALECEGPALQHR